MTSGNGGGLGKGESGREIDWRSRLRRKSVVIGAELEEATIEELAQHLEDLQEAALAEGVDVAGARARAVAAFVALDRESLERLKSRDRTGNLRARQADDTARAARYGGFVMSCVFALRNAVRHVRFHPGFAMTIALVLGLGIGATTTIYTVVDTVVLAPLPYEEPDRLVTIWDTNVAEGHTHDPISPVNFSDQRDLEVFDDAAAWWRPGVNLTDPGLDPIRVDTIEVSGNLFELLGVRPQVGAGFPENGPLFSRAELVAVISDRLWRTRYGGDPSIIGSQLSFNETPYTLLGVMPADFHYPDDVDVWQRLRWDMTQHSRQARFMEAVARLADGTTIERAQDAIDALWTHLESATDGSDNATGRGWGSVLVPLLHERLGYYRPALFVLFGAVGLLLCIGVLNVATLLITRALSREREMSLRLAIGASPKQLVAQLMAEGFVFSFLAALLGVAAAAWTLPLLVRLTPVSIPRLTEVSLSWESLGLGIAIASVTTVFFGLLPVFFVVRSRLSVDLKSGERGSSRGARRVYSVLVIAEVALACTLLTSSALLVRTVEQMVDTPTGVLADNIPADSILTTTIQLASTTYNEWSVVGATHSRIIEHIREQPGVEAVGASNFLPFQVGWRNPFSIQGDAEVGNLDDLPQVQTHVVSEGYFETMGARLAEGRAFSRFDEADRPGVVIVNESFARLYLADRPTLGTTVVHYSSAIGPLGRNLLGDQGPYPVEVVGVIRDIRNAPLGQPTEAALYFPARQYPFRELVLAIRSADATTGLMAVKKALRDLAPTVPMAAARSWGERLGEHTAEPRVLMTVLLFFGALAAMLATLGVYGLFSWTVAMRRRELAIRLTLGERPLRIGTMVVRQSVVLIAIGVVAGLFVLRLAESALAGVVFGVSASDTSSTLAASSLLLLAAVLACVPPAIRAMRVNPVEGLREE